MAEAPSRNQRLVLWQLARHSAADPGGAGVTCSELHRYWHDNREVPWVPARSTVRDHLQALARKGLAEQVVRPTAAYWRRTAAGVEAT